MYTYIQIQHVTVAYQRSTSRYTVVKKIYQWSRPLSGELYLSRVSFIYLFFFFNRINICFKLPTIFLYYYSKLMLIFIHFFCLVYFFPTYQYFCTQTITINLHSYIQDVQQQSDNFRSAIYSWKKFPHQEITVFKTALLLTKCPIHPSPLPSSLLEWLIPFGLLLCRPIW